jgi:hypothetical protein
LGRHVGESCKTRAYVRTDFEAFINQRFNLNSPVRLGIIPFSTQANISHYSNELPGLGNTLAWEVHRQLLGSEVFPIVEVLNRQDWPGKKEEFSTGNFGAITAARDAKYDLVMVGYLEPLHRLDTWIIHTKVIEVEAGVTLWYGTSRVWTDRADMLEVSSSLGLTDRRPDLIHITPLLEESGRCIAYDMLHDPEVD